jgi:hypothetical protein
MIFSSNTHKHAEYPVAFHSTGLPHPRENQHPARLTQGDNQKIGLSNKSLNYALPGRISRNNL